MSRSEIRETRETRSLAEYFHCLCGGLCSQTRKIRGKNEIARNSNSKDRTQAPGPERGLPVFSTRSSPIDSRRPVWRSHVQRSCRILACENLFQKETADTMKVTLKISSSVHGQFLDLTCFAFCLGPVPTSEDRDGRAAPEVCWFSDILARGRLRSQHRLQQAVLSIFHPVKACARQIRHFIIKCIVARRNGIM